MAEEGVRPRILKRIVFGYSADCFPGQLIVGHNQLKRKLVRAGFDVTVSMAPLKDLPPDVDILFVPPELAEAARPAASHCQVEVLETFLNHPLYDALIKKLDGTEWIARRLTDHPPAEESGQIVRYRGYERIE